MKPTNYTCPPARRIADWMNCTPENAKTARGLMQGTVSTIGNPAFPKLNAWLASCYNPPRRIDRILAALNELLECHGTEALWDGECTAWPVAEYLNTGDPYIPTILFRHDLGRFQLTTWGDWYERNEKRLHIADRR